MLKADSVAIVSGGLDSITMVYDLMVNTGYTPHLLSFNYGQRHNKELLFAAKCAKRLGLKWDTVDLTQMSYLISNSALTSPRRPITRDNSDGSTTKPDIEVPDGHYAEESMKATVVPNRNMIMLSIAGAVAVNNKYEAVCIGVHSGDHFIYPDCRPEFISACNAALWMGNEGFHNFSQEHVPYVGRKTDAIFAPFLNMTKADIAYKAFQLGVPIHQTWSCYKGGDKHCGKCGTCVERLEALHDAAQRYLSTGAVLSPDQTEYEDSEFWKTATKK